MTMKHLITLILLFVLCIHPVKSTENKMNSQIETHLIQLLQDLRVMVDSYKDCKNSQTCHYCGTNSGSTSSDTKGLRLVPVVHHQSQSGGYKLATWEEGLAECAKHGLTMATESQLQSAWVMGYDMCACGWLADGTVKYPITKARPGCGGTSTGLMTCSSDPKESTWNVNGGWDVYCSKTPVPVIHYTSPSGTYTLATWEEAKAECAKHGLTLATTAQLQAAWETGYDKCACGWLADGTVKYPFTKARSGCGGTPTGLMTCSSDPKESTWNINGGWDVYCSKAPVPVVHYTSPSGTYTLATWEEAKAECAKHGLTMATTAHLQAAWEAGYDKCACGWLADGSVKYPITKARSGCGTSTGLMTCSSDPKESTWNVNGGWDVYCFVGY